LRCDIAVWLSKLSVTSMWSMFYGASSFNSDVSNFDTSRVTDMGYRVTDMEYMFYGAKSFNQDLSNFLFSDACLVMPSHLMETCQTLILIQALLISMVSLRSTSMPKT